MKNMLNRILALTLCIALILGAMPADTLGRASRAAADALSSPAAFAGEDTLLEQAESLLAGGERRSGDWRYVLIEETNLAVITGYDGPAAEEIHIPALLDDADVVGLRSGTLAHLEGLRRVGMPINLLAIGEDALPTGAAVVANSGVYAQTWARRSGHAFISASGYDFCSGVVDLTGMRPENFNRVSANEIWLRGLEAGQISVGTRFFLLDPVNPYQISYYQASEMTSLPNGFVAITCTTPSVDSVVNYYEAQDETLMVDYSTLRLAENVSIDESDSKAVSGGFSCDLTLNLALNKSLSGGWKLSGSIGATSGWEASYKIGLFSDSSIQIEQKDKIEGSVSLEYTYDFNEVDHPEGGRVDLNDAAVEHAIKKAFDSMGQSAKGEGGSLAVPMGTAMVFSYAGLLNVAVTVSATVEFSGKVTISFSTTTTTTYNYSEDNGLTKSTKKGVRSLNGSVEGTLKVGVTVALELYITAFKAFTVSLFAGLQAEAKLDFSMLLNLLGNAIASNFTEDVIFDEAFNLNMMDCIQIDVYLVVEAAVQLGPDIINLGAKTTLLKWKFKSLHCHVLPVAFVMEPHEENGGYLYTVDSYKDKFHDTADCPYDVKTARFLFREDGRITVLQRLINLLIGSTVVAPELDMIGDHGVKLVGWHDDPSMDEDSLVEEWPYEIVQDVDFYADVRPMHTVRLIGADGLDLPAGNVMIEDPEADTEYAYTERKALAAEGERIVLPEQDADGEALTSWMLVESRTNLSPIGEIMEPGDVFEITADTADEVYLCALTEKDVMARFYYGVDNSYQTVFATRFSPIVVPECTGSIPCREFAGWEASDGSILQPGDEIPTDETTPSMLVFTDTWSYTGQFTVEQLDSIAVGSVPSVSTPVQNADMFSWREENGNAVITGFNITDELIPTYVSIPAYIDGYPVTAVDPRAFSGTETLRSIVFPYTVTSIGDSALYGCTSLVMIDLAVADISRVPDGFASGCTSLLCVLLPGADTEIGNTSFENCRSLKQVQLNAPIGEGAFRGCTRLSSAVLGGGVTTVGYGAFDGCTRLADVTIKGGVTDLGEHAFYNCSALTSLTIPESVTSIGANVIYGCSALETLEVNSGVTVIEDGVFDIGTVSALKKITLGYGVETINNQSLDNNGYGFTALTEIVLPGSIRSIGYNAFKGCAIETLTVGFSNGAEINGAFGGCTSLKTLNVESGFVSKDAFNGLTGLETVHIGAAVTGIGDNAFAGCTALKQLTFEEGILSIGYEAFARCTSLTSVSLPDSLTQLDDGIFSGCTALETLSVGAVLNRLEDRSYAFRIGTNSTLKNLIIREGAMRIPSYLFYNNGNGFTKLEALTLPASLTSIGSCAFQGAGLRTLTLNGSISLSDSVFLSCPSLEEVIINGGEVGYRAFEGSAVQRITVNAAVIGERAFYGCKSLTDVTLGSGVRTVGKHAFSGCSALVRVDLGDQVRSFGDYAFNGCTSLAELVFPDSVTSYGYGVVSGCTGLTRLTVGGGAYRIDSGTFGISGSNLTHLTLGEGVAVIGTEAFANGGSGHTKLTSVSFPSTLRLIESYAFKKSAVASLTFNSPVELSGNAFRDLTSLKSVNMPAGLVGASAFFGCTGLTAVRLGDQVSEVQGSAFQGCTSLASIYLGSRISIIGDNALRGCTSLRSITIPDSVTEMNANALWGCSGLEYLSVGAALDTFESELDLTPDSKLRHIVVREGATTITYWTFRNGGKPFKHLDTVVLPASLSVIEGEAFIGSSIKRLIIKGETRIGGSAFKNCRSLEEIYIEGGAVGEHAFSGCVNLKKATIMSGTIDMYAFSNCVNMESIHLGEGVASIGTYAFEYCRSLTSLTIPDSVTDIGESIIMGCTALETLTVGGGVSEFVDTGWYNVWSPFRVGKGSKLRTVVISEGVTYLDYHIFANIYEGGFTIDDPHGFTELETVVLPMSLEYLGGYAFSGSKIASITVPGTVNLDDNAFMGMSCLKTARIAGGIVGRYAFEGCAALESVELGDGVTAIQHSAFKNCTSLRSLIIPDSVTEYGNDMLMGCTALETLSIGGGVSSLGSSPFYIGEGAQLRMLEVREGVSRIEDQALANTTWGEPLGFSKLERVTLPESLVYLGTDNMEAWTGLKHLYLHYGSVLPQADSVSPELTLYSDYFNAMIDDFALAHGLKYVIREDEPFPVYTLNRVVPAGSVTDEVLEVSGGSVSVTDGAIGTPALLPEGYALLSRSTMEFSSAIDAGSVTPAEGYAFYGWYTDRALTERWAGSSMPASDLTLYARVEPLLRVRFAVNSAAAGMADETLPAGWYLYSEYSAEEFSELILPSDPAAAGMNFMGWYLDEACTLRCTLTEVPENGVTVYGRMERMPIGGEYRAVEGGLQLTGYTLTQGESAAVSLPVSIGGVPLVSIASGAFAESGVRSLVIPSGVTEIQPGALNCSTLVSVGVSAANTAYRSVGGVLFSADLTELVCYPAARYATDYTLPEETLVIGSHAFENALRLKSIGFNDVLTEIGKSAFAGCTGFTRIDLPDSVSVLRSRAFEGCVNLESFYAYGLIVLEDTDVVNGRTVRVNTLPIGTGMKVFGPVGEGVLRDYFLITNSDGVSSTTQYNLYQVSLYAGSWETMYCEAGTLLPDLLNDVTLDDGGVIAEWRANSEDGEVWNLTSDLMPAENLTLFAVTVPLFEGDPAGEAEDASGAILTAYNGSAERVVVPETYQNTGVIGLSAAFLSSCASVKELVVGSHVISMEYSPDFTGTVLTDPDSYAAQWADENGVSCDWIEYTLSFVTAGDPISSMKAAKNTAVALPEPARAGFSFTGWYLDSECTAAAELTDGFYLMPAADTVLYAGWDGEEAVLPFTWTSAGRQITITGYTGEAASVVIPGDIGGWPVVAVADSAFAGSDVTHIDLGSVQTIGDSAFEGCESLRSVTMNSVSAIGDSAFEGCSALSAVTLPDSLISLGESAFGSCSALKRVTVGSGLSSLTADHIAGCTQLKEFYVSSGSAHLKSVDGVLFDASGETLLCWPAARAAESYTVPEGVVRIARRAFANARYIGSVTLPDSVSVIGEQAFAGSSLTSINLTSVEEIGESAFFGTNLTGVELGGGLTSLGAFAFTGCTGLTGAVIPAGVELDADALYFTRTGSMTITGETGSSAQEYAAANGIAFVDPNAAAPEGISLSETDLTLNLGDMHQLTAAIEPADAAADVSWLSADPAVVTVDESGLLRAISGGTALVRARTANGLCADCRVTVIAEVTALIPEYFSPITVGSSAAASVAFVPANPTDPSLAWTSSDETVARVSESGVIEAVGLGEAIVTATAANGVSAEIPVVVYTPVETFSLPASGVTLEAAGEGSSLLLVPAITPDSATFTGAAWYSSNPSLLAVDNSGMLRALGVGTATVTAISADPARPASETTVTIAAMDIAKASIEVLSASLTDGVCTVSLSVTAGEELLVEGVDYSVSMDEITLPGTYTLTVSGKNRLTGSAEIEFTLQLPEPEITLTDARFSWLDDLAPVVSIEPEAAYTLEYALIGEDGSRIAVDAPSENGLYEITVRTEATDTLAAGEASTTMWIQLNGGAVLYDSITLVPGLSGFIPVATESEYAPVQSGWRWQSSNEKVLAADESGRLTAISEGVAVVTVTSADDARFTAECTVTVTGEATALTLPAALTSVEEEAFAGSSAAAHIVLGESVSEIGARAFADLPALVVVEIASGSAVIAEDAFDGSSPVIVCSEGSTACAYADAHGLKRLCR